MLRPRKKTRNEGLLLLLQLHKLQRRQLFHHQLIRPLIREDPVMVNIAHREIIEVGAVVGSRQIVTALAITVVSMGMGPRLSGSSGATSGTGAATSTATTSVWCKIRSTISCISRVLANFVFENHQLVTMVRSVRLW